MPDEFVRRAAMGEHLFTEVARIEPIGSRTSVALFDAGPDQQGAPRLVHLALLVVLASRAAAVGARFLFGTLQDIGELHELNADSMLRMLRARTFEPARETHLADWGPTLVALAVVDDRWVVAAPAAANWRSKDALARVVVDDVDEPDVAALDVRAIRPWAPEMHVRLDQPGPDVASRTLRNPTSTRRPAEAHRGDSPISGETLVLTHGGRRLVLRRGDGGLEALHIPNSAREPRGRSRMIAPHRGEEIIGIDFAMRRTFVLSRRIEEHADLIVRSANLPDHHMHLESARGLPGTLSPFFVTNIARAGSTEHCTPEFVVSAWLCDVEGALLWSFASGPRQTKVDAMRMAMRCAPVRVSNDEIVWIETDEEGAPQVRSNQRMTYRAHVHSVRDGRVHLGAKTYRAPDWWVPAAVEVAEPDGQTRVWVTVHEHGDLDGPIVGLRGGGLGDVEQLWRLDRERRSIRETRSSSVIVTTTTPILRHAFDPHSQTIAWATSDEIGVYRCERGEVVLRMVIPPATNAGSRG
jgi:hypothetical protein